MVLKPTISEIIATNFDEIYLSNAIKVLQALDSNGLDCEQAISSLMESVCLKTQEAIYAFHTNDALGYLSGYTDTPDGVELFKRNGNLTRSLCSGDGSNWPINTAIKVLKDMGIKQILTGPIHGKFLGVLEQYEVETHDSWDKHVKQQLQKDEITAFEKAGISVKVLDLLI